MYYFTTFCLLALCFYNQLANASTSYENSLKNSYPTRILKEVCGGYGHLHGSTCHCNSGYKLDDADPKNCVLEKGSAANKLWEQSTFWKFEKGGYFMSICNDEKDESADGLKLALQNTASLSEESINLTKQKAQKLLSTFSSNIVPRIEIGNFQALSPHPTKNYDVLFRIDYKSTKDHHKDHDNTVEECSGRGHLHGDHCHCNEGFKVDPKNSLKCVKDEGKPTNTPHNKECSGHGHLHGDHCHCDEGFEVDTKNPSKCTKKLTGPSNSSESVCGGKGHLHGDECHCDTQYMIDPTNSRNCVEYKKFEVAKCSQRIVVGINITKTGFYGMFTDIKLHEHDFAVYNADGIRMAFNKCIDGCETEKNKKLLTTTEKWGLTILATLLTSLIPFFGVFLLCVKNKKIFLSIVNYMSSFASGTLIAAVMIHIYPEAQENLAGVDGSWQLPTCFLGGLAFGMIIEQGLHIMLLKYNVSHHGHSHCDSAIEDTPSNHSPKGIQYSEIENSGDLEANNGSDITKDQSNGVLRQVKPVAWIVGLGDFFHNFTDGVIIAIAFQSCSSSTGWIVTLGVFCHEIPQTIANFFIFLKAGLSIGQTIIFSFLISTSDVIGAVLLLSIGKISNEILGYLLAFGCGMLVFIALVEILPGVLAEIELRKAVINFVLFCIGAVAIGLTMLKHTHCDYSGAVHEH